MLGYHCAYTAAMANVLEQRIAALEAAVENIQERTRLHEELLDALSNIVLLFAAQMPGQAADLSVELRAQLENLQKSRAQSKH